MPSISRYSIAQISIFTFIAFVILSSLINGKGYTDLTSTLVSAASFLFGILVSFLITNKQTRLTKINELLKIDEANLLSIYKISVEFGSDVQDKVRQLIDNNLVDQIDYKLVDYKNSSHSYYQLFDYIVSLKPKGSDQEIAYDQIFSLLNSTTANRKQVETMVLEKITPYEWVSILSLLGIMYAFLLDLNSGSFFSVVTISILATTSTILTVVLRDLDNLKWQADRWIWEPLHNLFLDLELLPYYAEGVLQNREAHPPVGSKVRIAHYKSPYPEIKDKVVKVSTIE